MAQAISESVLMDIAHSAIKEWDIQISNIDLIAIMENSVFRVSSVSGKSYVLRIHRPGYHSLDELDSELDWTAALYQAKVPVPRPVRTREGRGYVTTPVPDSSETRHVGLVEWIEGVPLASVIDTKDKEGLAERFNQIGRLAACIHNQASEWTIPTSFRRHAFDADGLMGDSPFWGPFWSAPLIKSAERKQILRARGAIYRTLSEHGKNQGTYSLIHADLHPRNLIADGNRLYAIDFDDSGFGYHQYELAVALYAYQDEPIFDQIRDSLVSGYRSERKLEDSALDMLPVFLLIRSLALIGWINDRPELKQDKRQRKLIEWVCEQSENLFKRSLL